MFYFSFSSFLFLVLFLFLKKCFSLFVFILFQHLYQGLTKDVSSVVGAPWRCGVLTKLGGIAGIGLGRLLSGEHATTRQSGVEAPRLMKRSLSRLYYCCCCLNGLCALDADTLFFKRRDPWRATTIAHSGGHSSHDEHP